uniref:Chitin-binding type-2 domain-containing protein n=1 Tax=Anopheles funestus TaxID=62324 RepID=A0A4Y0BM05_ANOFN
MKGVTMGVETSVTLAVVLYLATVLEATYLERPLWVADKGRQQLVGYANEEPPRGQFQAANEPTWIIPEPYYLQRNGPANQQSVENRQRPQESPDAAQLVREERHPNQGFDERNLPEPAYEYQAKYKPQGTVNGQVEYQKPYLSLEPSKLQAQPEPEYYEPYGQQGWNREPKPELAQPNKYQPQFQMQENYKPYRPDAYQPKPEAELAANQPRPGTFRPNQPNVESFPSKPQDMQNNYSPKRPQQEQQSNNPQPARPEWYQPSPSFVEAEYEVPYYGQQAKPSYTDQESVYKQPSRQPSKPAEQPNKVKKPQPQENQGDQGPLGNSDYFPYQSQEAWHPYEQNPMEGYQATVKTGPPNRVGNGMPIYELPSRQGSYDREPIVDRFNPDDRVVQQQDNRKPPQPVRTEQRPNRPVERVPEEPQYQPNRVPSMNWDAQYKPQPAPVMPKPQPSPVMPKPQPAPVVPKPQPAPVMPNPQPPPVMPKPQPAPVMPKPQQRPPVVEPTYNRRPEPYYGSYDDNDNEGGFNYEKPITHFNKRCPREDDPAKPVHFPSTTSCVKFQKCFNGIAYEMSCPSGLEFDFESNRCDYPARARCSV